MSRTVQLYTNTAKGNATILSQFPALENMFWFLIKYFDRFLRKWQ